MNFSSQEKVYVQSAIYYDGKMVQSSAIALLQLDRSSQALAWSAVWLSQPRAGVGRCQQVRSRIWLAAITCWRKARVRALSEERWAGGAGRVASREGSCGVGLKLCGRCRSVLRVCTPPRRHGALLLLPLVARLVPAQPQRHDGGRNKHQRIQPLQSETSQCSPSAAVCDVILPIQFGILVTTDWG